MNEHAAEHHASKFTSRQRTIALIIVAMAFVMDLLDNTIVNIAIPSIQANLHASYATIQWLIAGYALTFALLLITGGRMGDVFGYKKIFLIGISGFTLASLLSGIAPNPEFLVGARLLQGSMAALMVPQVMSLMQVMYKPSERGGVMGLFGMLGGLSASLGPIVGGILIKANLFGWDWRPIFLINLPVGIFAFFAAVKYLPKGKSSHPLKLDLVGTGIIVVALSLLIFPLIQGRDLDWPTWTLVMLGTSIPAIALFGWYEKKRMKRDGSALIVPELFKLRSFSMGLVMNILLESIMIGFFLVFTLILQIGLGFDVLSAALVGIPTAVGIGLSIALTGQLLVPKLGRNTIILGSAVLAAGYIGDAWVISHFGLSVHGWYFIPSLFITGLGLGMVMAPVFSVALRDVDTAHAGSASGILNAVQQVGAAIGVAVIGVIFFGQINGSSLNSFDAAAAPKLQKDLSAMHVPAQAQTAIIEGVRKCFNDRSTQKDSSIVPESCKQLEAGGVHSALGEKIGKSIDAAVKSANAQNFISANKATVTYELILLVVGSLLTFALPKKFKVAQEG